MDEVRCKEPGEEVRTPSPVLFMFMDDNQTAEDKVQSGFCFCFFLFEINLKTVVFLLRLAPLLGRT